MNTKFTRILLTTIFLLGGAVASLAQNKSENATPQNAASQSAMPKPVVYTTTPKLSVAKLNVTETEVYDVRGKVTFTVTAANSDDTVAGTMNYTLPDDARQKIASITGKPLNSIPPSITRKDVIAGFQKATAPPIINLEISPMDVDVLGAKVHFNRIVLDINAKETGAKFSNDEMEALFTIWARQILNGRSRRGIIAAMNRRIAGEDDQ